LFTPFAASAPLAGFSHLDVMLVECYDPKADQWNILQTPILEGRSGPGCAILDDSIFLVGGYSWSMVRPTLVAHVSPGSMSSSRSHGARRIIRAERIIEFKPTRDLLLLLTGDRQDSYLFSSFTIQ
jgi:hypothetical protein